MIVLREKGNSFPPASFFGFFPPKAGFLCGSDYPGTCFIDQAGCTTTPGSY